jgi:hypothetical protein
VLGDGVHPDRVVTERLLQGRPHLGVVLVTDPPVEEGIDGEERPLESCSNSPAHLVGSQSCGVLIWPSRVPASPGTRQRIGPVIVVHDSGRLYPEAIIFTTTAPQEGEK